MTDSTRKSNIRVERYLRATVLNDVVELEKRVWKKEGYREVNAPMLYFELAYLTNGLILTAFDEGVYSPQERETMAKDDPWYEGDRPIGFAALFADFDHNGPFWYGARMGVDDRYQDKNVGDALVAALYDSAKERNIPRIRWTFDPLQSRNGYIYLRKMGGLVREIGFNYYSAVFTNDQFNRGISTDRFIVEWMIGSGPGAHGGMKYTVIGPGGNHLRECHQRDRHRRGWTGNAWREMALSIESEPDLYRNSL
jgi:predicted GNAT superfamily acetyltransferase